MVAHAPQGAMCGGLPAPPPPHGFARSLVSWFTEVPGPLHHLRFGPSAVARCVARGNTRGRGHRPPSPKSPPPPFGAMRPRGALAQHRNSSSPHLAALTRGRLRAVDQQHARVPANIVILNRLCSSCGCTNRNNRWPTPILPRGYLRHILGIPAPIPLNISRTYPPRARRQYLSIPDIQ
jgi:hypothetical protein